MVMGRLSDRWEAAIWQSGRVEEGVCVCVRVLVRDV